MGEEEFVIHSAPTGSPPPILRLLLAALWLTGLAACEPEREISDIQVLFDADLSEGFWSFPFPSDHRRIAARRAGGLHPDLWDFPNPSDSDMLAGFLSYGSTRLDGFGLNSPINFAFDGPVALPAWGEAEIEASLNCEGPVRIVDVDPDSPERGRCRPARIHWIGSSSTDPYVVPNMLQVGPYWGFPLLEQTTYAVTLVDLQDHDEAWLEAPPALVALLEGSSSNAGLQTAFQPLTDELARQGVAGEELKRIGAATVFTTRSATDEMARLATRVLTDPDLPSWNEDEGVVRLDEEHDEFQGDFEVYEGAYTALNFQEGTIPYSDHGGGFVWRDDGQPVPQSEERIPFVLATPPPIFEQPDEGWPVLLHAHGTGGDRYSHITRSGNQNPASMAGSRGFLSIGIPQPIHGDRWPEGSSLAISLYSFNYENPDSGLSMFRQGAVDTVALVRFVQENLVQGGTIAEQHPQLKIDPERIYFLGHSQGGLTGAMALPFTPGIKAWVLSGAGGGLSMTVMQREDPLVFREAVLANIQAPEGTDLFEMHPLLGLIQALSEVTDPVNYGPLWVDRATGDPASVLLTEGIHDEQTPADTSEALAVSGGLPIARPYREREVFGLTLRGLGPLSTPYSGNATHSDGSEVTTGLAQFDANHFAIFQEPDAGLLWANFLWSQLRDGAPGELGGTFP